MTVKCTSRYATHPADYARYDMQQLKDHYLVNGLFRDDEINFVYTHYDRLMVGGAKPVDGGLVLETVDQLKAPYFLERRELGAINVGGPGRVEVGDETYELGYKDALYVGAGNEKVVFHSDDAANPAKFYLNAAPAHTAYPTKRITLADADKMALGSPETSNERVINKLIVNSVVEVCQLQMGMTQLKTGSVWNTMPAHQHDLGDVHRKAEIEIRMLGHVPHQGAGVGRGATVAGSSSATKTPIMAITTKSSIRVNPRSFFMRIHLPMARCTSRPWV